MVISNSLEDLETEKGLEVAAEPVSHHLLYMPYTGIQNLYRIGGHATAMSHCIICMSFTG